MSKLQTAISVLIVAGILCGGWLLAAGCHFSWCPLSDSEKQKAGTVVFENENIHVSSPLPNATITSPLIVRGEAKGTWYFEASFPVRVLDANGKTLGVIPAQAQADWMTTNFVPFEATVSFERPLTKEGTLVLVKDNPSGLPQNEASISIPIIFGDFR